MMRKNMSAIALMALAGMNIEREVSKIIGKEKPCLNCGVTYFHKKRFCSAKCCKEYKPNE